MKAENTVSVGVGEQTWYLGKPSDWFSVEKYQHKLLPLQLQLFKLAIRC